MCFILCFCCNSCNNFSSKCIEITILILLICSFSATFIGLIFVKIDHASIEGYACLLVVISLSLILIITIIIIIIWRFNSTINNKRNKIASAFSSLGLILTIFCVLFTGIYENMSISHFYELDYPCKSIQSTEVKSNNKTNLILLLRRNLLTYEENKEEFCLDNPDYNIHIITQFEYIYVLTLSSTLEVIFLVLLYFWYNDFRRIKFFVDGKLIDSNTKENKIQYKDKKEKFNNHILYGKKDYVVHYDIYGRPIIKQKIFKQKINKPKIINLKQKSIQINVNNNIKEKEKENNLNNEQIQNNNQDIKDLIGNEGLNIYKLYISNGKKKLNNINFNINLSKSTSKASINDNPIINSN